MPALWKGSKYWRKGNRSWRDGNTGVVYGPSGNPLRVERNRHHFYGGDKKGPKPPKGTKRFKTKK